MTTIYGFNQEHYDEFIGYCADFGTETNPASFFTAVDTGNGLFYQFDFSKEDAYKAFLQDELGEDLTYSAYLGWDTFITGHSQASGTP